MSADQSPAAQNFGEYFRSKRVLLGLTLRAFCERFGLDPAYISRLENGIIAPPQDKEKLTALAQALRIKEESSDRITFFDLAFLSKGKIPQDIIDDRRSAGYLPLLFRTARGQRLSRKKLEELIRLVNKK